MLALLIPIPHGRKGTNLEGWSSLPPEELARKFQDNNGGNRGLRLDHYVSIDPDTPAAETVCETWEREGKLPPTWTWRTARGVIRRLYLRPQELLDTLTIEAISLQLRTGNKYYDVIPPSYVKDPKKGIDGFYTWLPDQDPYSISIAPLPQEILEYFKKHAGKGRLTQNTCERRSEPTGAHLDVEAYLNHYGRELVKVKPHQGGNLFCLRACVFDDAHQPNEAAIFQAADGILSYQCFHDSCRGRTWAEAREKISGEDKLGDFMTGGSCTRPNEPPPDKNLNQTDPQCFRIVSANRLLTRQFSEQDEVIGGGILPNGAGLLIAGESGVGKSLFRTELAIHIAMGMDYLNLKIPKPRRVLIIQFENTERTEQYRLRRMLIGLGIDSFPDHLCFSSPTQRFDLKSKRDFQSALDLVTESNAEVIIWDPLTSLHSVNENDNVQIRGILDSITQINRKTNSTSIVIHHFGKPQEGVADAHRTRGGSSIRDWADTLITMTRKPHEDKTLINIGFAKVRNGPEPKKILLERDKSYFVHYLSEEDVLCSPSKVKTILLRMGGRVEQQKILIEAIMKETGCSERSAKSFINLAVEKGVIRATLNPQNKKLKIYEIDD